MTTAVETPAAVPAELIDAALGLPPDAREAFGVLLLDSLEPGLVDPATAGRAWTAEVTRRLAAFERGDMAATDWRQALARVEQRLQERRP